MCGSVSGEAPPAGHTRTRASGSWFGPSWPCWTDEREPAWWRAGATRWDSRAGAESPRSPGWLTSALSSWPFDLGDLSRSRRFRTGEKGQSVFSRSTLRGWVRNSAHPDEQLRHDHVSQLTGGVQGRARQRGGPGLAAVDLLLGAVGQEQQQSGQIPVRHRTQQPGGHAVLWELGPQARLEGRHKLPLFILGPDPRLPFLPGKQAQAGARQNPRSG